MYQMPGRGAEDTCYMRGGGYMYQMPGRGAEDTC